MVKRERFSVNIIARKCKEDKTKAWLYARITMNGKAAELSLQHKIVKDNWDTKKEVVKGNSTEISECNEDIIIARRELKAIYEVFKRGDNVISAIVIKTAYLKSKGIRTGKTLLQLTAYFLKIWKEKLSWGSMKNYLTTVDYLHVFVAKEFAGSEGFLEDLNIQFATNFEHHIRTCPINPSDPCIGNGVAKHIQRFKRILNWAKEIGWAKENGCDKYSCVMKKSRRKKLRPDELKTLEMAAIEEARLAFVRDLFVFSCYTGFAFADVVKLTRSDFETDDADTIWCRIYRTKSDILAPVPLLPQAVQLFTRYRQDARNQKRETIFPPITNQQVNKGLKTLRDACVIDTPVTFHVARHTFAKTVALRNGVPLETVQMMLGRTKISTTQLYAEVDEEKILSDMQLLQGRLAAKAD